jgi:hypothetical protein
MWILMTKKDLLVRLAKRTAVPRNPDLREKARDLDPIEESTSN